MNHQLSDVPEIESVDTDEARVLMGASDVTVIEAPEDFFDGMDLDPYEV